MNYKAAILMPKEGAKPEPVKAAAAGPGHADYATSTCARRIPSYFSEDKHSYRVFSEEEADYLDRCSPTDRERVITLLKSGKLRIGWDVCYDDVTKRVTKSTKATMVSRKGSVKPP